LSKSEKKPPSDQRLIARYRQFKQGEEATAEYRYCLLLLSAEMKLALLSKDHTAVANVAAELFARGLLLIGNGPCHVIEVLEEKDLVGAHEAVQLVL
jgi:hypothetical protein